MRVVAVLVVVADGGYTGPTWVTLRARWTAAGGDVCDSFAKGVASTRCSQGARILTISVDTALVEWTIVIRGTFSYRNKYVLYYSLNPYEDETT